MLNGYDTTFILVAWLGRVRIYSRGSHSFSSLFHARVGREELRKVHECLAYLVELLLGLRLRVHARVAVYCILLLCSGNES
jgi:hypothetical protein